jgi:hypothetical protein
MESVKVELFHGSSEGRMVPAQKVNFLAPQEAKPSADLERNPRGEKVSANPKEEKNEAGFLPERVKKRLGLEPCKTCQNRRYQDASNDPGVSFKSPTVVSPQAAPALVRAHEGEHVRREQARAEGEDRRVVYQYVQLQTSICPECGRVYVSGGKAVTATAPRAETPYSAARQDASIEFLA